MTLITNAVVVSRPVGGHLFHLRLRGQPVAYCGFKPSAPKGTIIRNRCGWFGTINQEPTCKKCLKREAWLKRRMSER